MKSLKLLLSLFLFSVTSLTAISQETQYIKVVNSRVNSKPSPSALIPKWAMDVTEGQKRILAELINSMVYVEGGTFLQGNNDDYDAKPIHSVTLSDFYIGKYEVTQKEWQTVMGKNPSRIKSPQKPVDKVSWNDCNEFIRRLNALTGLEFMLPSEAQWEYAARGGNMSKGYNYSGSNDLNSVAWYSSNSDEETHPVGQKQPNELGLYDMTGNVWEWCSDAWYNYDSNSTKNPKHNGDTDSNRVYRGGSWYNSEILSRVWFRYASIPNCGYITIGLRLVINP